jgi:hypothetical protein
MFDVAVRFPRRDYPFAIGNDARFMGWQAYPLTPPIIVEVTARGSGGHTYTVSRWRLTADNETLQLVPDQP